jgi:signal transduction histidine kinase
MSTYTLDTTLIAKRKKSVSTMLKDFIDNAKRRIPLAYIISIILAVAVSICCLIILTWIYLNSYKMQVDSVREKHLLIAQNLSGELERYAKDSLSTLEYVAQRLQNGELTNQNVELPERPMLSGLIRNLDISALIKINDASIETIWLEKSAINQDQLSGDLLLKALDPFPASKSKSFYQEALSTIGSQHWLVLQTELPDGAKLVALQSTKYLRDVQRKISFGRLGHAAMFDKTGRVIAHPVERLEQLAANASGISIVKLMMEGKTGVAEFFSPPMNGDMIAGYTMVPGPGWGVMVPQPISELREATKSIITSDAYVVVFALLLSLLVGSFIGFIILKPLKSVTTAVRAVTREQKFDKFVEYTPISRELDEFVVAYNRMLDVVNEGREELEGSLDKAVQANNAKDVFLASVGHELITPLNGVVGMLTIASQSECDMEIEQSIETALRCSFDIKQILDDILLIQNLQKKSVTVENREVDLRKFMDHLKTTYTADSQDKNVTFQMDLQNSLASDLIHIDETKIRQIAVNLISNAYKFTKQGAISVFFRLEILAGQKTLTLSVADTGIGIDNGFIRSVFDPFIQVDNRYERERNGLGLGLFISRRLAEAMNGRLEVESKLGSGSTFRLTVPLELANDGA